MLSKNELKTLTKYKQDKYRRSDGLFVVEGVKLAQELLRSDFEVVLICALGDWIEENRELLSRKFSKDTDFSSAKWEALKGCFAEPNHRFNFSKQPFGSSKQRLVAETSCYAGFDCVVQISEGELDKLSLLSTPNKVWCLVRKPQIEDAKVQGGLVILLDGIKDPGNLGTIVRLADWFDVERVVCSADCVDLFNPKTVQSTMGSIFRVKVQYENAVSFLETLPKDYAVCGSLVECGDSVYSQSLSERSVLIIGSESHGISPQVRRYITQVLNIPCFKAENRPESLNAAIACSILVSEFRRKIPLKG